VSIAAARIRDRRLLVLCAFAAALGIPAAVGATAKLDGAPRERLTAADNGRAASALIRESDLIASFRVDPNRIAEPWIPHCANYPGDRSDITITGAKKSAFTDGLDGIGSTTLFFKSYGDLERYWLKTVRAQYAPCLAQVYAHTRQVGVRAQTLVAKQLRLGPTGATKAAAFRVVSRLWRDGAPFMDWYQTVVFISSGRGLSIIAIEYADQPCNCHTGLATLLARRLRLADQG
jgi:hypothetical protein